MRFPKPTGAKKSSKPVENSQLQPDEPLEFPPVQDSHAHVIMERDTDSTASSPQPPLPIGMRFSKSTGVRNGAGNHGIPANGEHLPSKNTSPKTSPMKVQKFVKIKRRSSRTSLDVWEYFTQEDTEAGPVAICAFCKQVYKCDRGFHGTSTLQGHLLYRCSSCPFTNHDKRRKLSLQDHRFSAKNCRRGLAKMIIMDEYPFSAVEGEGFREYSKILQPEFEPPSRYTVARDYFNLYLEEKMKLKEALRDQRVCLMTDTWTSIQNQNFMSLTAHWINNQWELERKVLNFCFVPDHAGNTLGRMIEECLLEWDIGQVFTLTVDNASSNNTAIGYLKTANEHWPSTICSNQFLHVRCSGGEKGLGR
uniref:Uncharacterized protein n=1 Tax=Avena sativa TaxID=4498 RepID=A0ACD5WZR0_AVESA